MIIVANSDIMGKNIRRLRHRRWMSRRRLASLVHLPVPELREIEKGTLRDIDSVVLIDICRLFRVEMQDMIYKRL